MAHRYFVSPNGSALSRTGGVLPAPAGWKELTEEEYRAYRADERPSAGPVTVRTLAEVRAS